VLTGGVTSRKTQDGPPRLNEPGPKLRGTSSPGIKNPTTIVFFEVSIPRWIGPAAGVTLGMTVGSLPPFWRRFAGLVAPSSFW
jgi:hypothetical protein